MIPTLTVIDRSKNALDFLIKHQMRVPLISEASIDSHGINKLQLICLAALESP